VGRKGKRKSLWPDPELALPDNETLERLSWPEGEEPSPAPSDRPAQQSFDFDAAPEAERPGPIDLQSEGLSHVSPDYPAVSAVV